MRHITYYYIYDTAGIYQERFRVYFHALLFTLINGGKIIRKIATH